jgi:hypothetical protein
MSGKPSDFLAPPALSLLKSYGKMLDEQTTLKVQPASPGFFALGASLLPGNWKRGRNRQRKRKGSVSISSWKSKAKLFPNPRKERQRND